MKKSLLSLALFAGFSSVSNAATWDITVTNLTHGNHFTPILLKAHAHGEHLFQVGSEASTPIEHMAECGHLVADLTNAITGSVNITNPVAADSNFVLADGDPGFLPPGKTVTAASLTVTDQTHLTAVAMVLPTNDGFMGLDSQHVPTEAGTYTYWVNAYDAGTEQNDEMLATSSDSDCAYTDTTLIPGGPGGDTGTGGTGVSGADSNSMIHVHRGVLGDDNPTGGKSDLSNTIHRWQNPVAKIVVTVTP